MKWAKRNFDFFKTIDIGDFVELKGFCLKQKNRKKPSKFPNGG